MTVYGAVFARGGSKGVRGKNLREIAGRSLLSISIDLGRNCELIERVLVSTDSKRIMEAALAAGAEVPFRRPAELSKDDSAEWLSWQHLSQYLIDGGASPSDTLVSLPTTAPLRAMTDVVSAITLFHKQNYDLVLGVARTNTHPAFNMVRRSDRGDVSLMMPITVAPVTVRQAAPQAYVITTTVYVTSLDFVLNSGSMFSGRVGSVVVPEERAIDIDTELELELAAHLLKKRESITDD